MIAKLPEPWLRGSLTEVPPVLRAVLHALELCSNDVQRFCEGLSSEELNASPFGLPPVAFHLKHIARSTDRLLSYAEGRTLSDDQLTAKQSELEATSTRAELFSELDAALQRSAVRIREFSPSGLDEVRLVGRKQLPTTVAGLLVHVADHVQRHVGQVVTTTKIVLAQRR
jgi:uncharacterized damage-inducible protein DinB